MSDIYIKRKLTLCTMVGEASVGMHYSYQLFKGHSPSLHLAGGVFEVYDIVKYDEIIEKICRDISQAILFTRHDSVFIRKLCECKLTYKLPIQIYYEPDYI